jgi:sodium pump decarboxylase gamma subunit
VADIIEGLDLMWKGMTIVFGFLFLLMVYMYLIPYIKKSKNRSFNDLTQKNIQNTENKVINTGKPAEPVETVPDELAAAIAAAIYSHTGKRPKQMFITPTPQPGELHNVWGVAGRQDLMLSRDLTGQVGFQY